MHASLASKEGINNKKTVSVLTKTMKDPSIVLLRRMLKFFHIQIRQSICSDFFYVFSIKFRIITFYYSLIPLLNNTSSQFKSPLLQLTSSYLLHFSFCFLHKPHTQRPIVQSANNSSPFLFLLLNLKYSHLIQLKIQPDLDIPYPGHNFFFPSPFGKPLEQRHLQIAISIGYCFVSNTNSYLYLICLK